MLKTALKKIPPVRYLAEQIRYSGLGSTARTILRERHTFLRPGIMRNLERSARTVVRRGIPGDIVEFGLGPGGSAVVLSQFAGPGRAYHGFDVFAMIPPPTSPKDDDRSRARYQVIAAGRAGDHGANRYYGYREDLLGDIRALLARFGRPEDGRQVFLHKGLFEETVPHHLSARIAFAHVDCDWYDPVKYCLEAVAPRLERGGLIVVDDYPEFGGCKAATDEFMEAHGQGLRATMRKRLVIERIA